MKDEFYPWNKKYWVGYIERVLWGLSWKGTLRAAKNAKRNKLQ